MAYEWTEFTDYLDGERVIRKEERDELWDALAWLLDNCGGRYQLNGVDMAAIKASLFITDLTSVDDTEAGGDPVRGDLAAILIAIEDIFTGETGLDAFKAVAGDEGLSEAQLAEFVTEDGRATEVETYHLWNLYKRVLESLTCCPTSVPTFEWESRSASKTKNGYQGYNEAGGSNGVFYLNRSRTWAWTMDMFYESRLTPTYWCCRASIDTQVGSYSGTWDSVYDPASNTFTDGPLPPYGSYTHTEAQNHTRTDYDPETEVDCAANDTSTETEEPMDPVACPYFDSTPSDARHIENIITPTSLQIHRWISGHFDELTTCAGSKGDTEIDCTDTTTVSNPYTDEVLETTTWGALPAFDGDWNDTAGSFRNRSGNTLSIRDSKARIKLTGEDLVDGQTYRAYFAPRFTPVGGGAAVIDDEAYIEFTFSGGMAFTDEIIPDFPSENGTIDFIGIRWECGPFE
jgi:hypothetical protein